MQSASIGPYVLEGELGRGGTGVVFRARAPDGRPVALKLLTATRPEAWARFEREVRIQRELAAEGGFVAVLDLGRDPRGPYLVQELVPGGTLRERLRGPWPALDVLELGAALATALGRAHALGVVHRDVKPENVLFDPQGRALLIDLGLAKHVAGDTGGLGLSRSLSVDGELRGTAGYMPPEQMADAKSADARSDVFACGAILYECAAGQPAFAGHGPIEVIEAATQGRRVPLRKLRPDLPDALGQVIERCLAREPSARYADGAALAAALAQVDLAAPAGRRRASLVTLGALALAAAAGAAWSTAGGDAEGEAAARPSAPPIGDAPLAARPATRPADEPEPAPRADAPPAAAGGEVLAESDERGDVLEEHHEEDDGSEPQADAAARGASPRPGLRTDLAALTALEPLEQLGAGRTKHVAPVRGVAVDANGLGYALDARGWLRAYALPSGASRGVVRLVRGEPGPWAVAPDGQRVAVADREGGRGRVRSLRGGPSLELTGLERITTLAWAPDSRRLAVAHAGGVSLVDIEARRASSLLAAEDAGPASTLAFGAGGGLVIGCEAGPLFAFSAAPPYVRAKLGGHPGVRALALAPDGALAASGGGGALGLWDARALRLRRERRLDAGEVLELRFVADRRLLVLCERAAVWLDAESGEQERRVASPRPNALAASSPDGRHAIAVGPGGARVRFYDLEAGRETPSVRGHGGAVVATASSPRGLITLGAGGDPLAWRDGTPYLLGAELAALRAPAPPRALATLADGRAMLVVTGRGELHLLDFVEARARQVAGDGPAAHAAASARGDAFVVIGEDGVARGLDASGRTTLTRQAHAVAGERVLPGEGGLLTLGRGAGGPEAALWRAAELVNRFPIVPARAAVRLGPAWLALGGADGAITLFDLSRGSASAHVEEAHPGGVLALGADPTGRLLLSSGEDGSVACWEATADGLRLLERAELATTHDLVVSISPLRQHGRAALALGTARGAVVVCGWR